MAKIIVSKKHALKGHKEGVYALERSADQDVFFSAGADGFIARWDFKDPENGRLMAKLPSSVYALKYNEAANELIIGQNFDGIHIIDLGLMKETASLKLTKAAIFDIKIFEDKIYVASGEGQLALVDRKSMSVIHKVRASEKSARAIAVNPQTNEIAVGYSDHMIRIFDAGQLTLKKEIDAHANSVFTLEYSPDSQWLVSGSRDAHMKFWLVGNDYELSEEIVAHMYAINQLQFSPNGKYIASCSMDKSVKIWDAEKRKLLKVIDKARHAGHGTSVNCLMWAPEHHCLLSGSDDRLISVWLLEKSL